MNPHAIVIEQNPNRVRVTFKGQWIADTRKGLILREGKLPRVRYFPREDVDMTLLERTNHSSHCPFKGDAAYYTINVQGNRVENAAWTYESPIPAVAAIKDHLAFYEEKLDGIEETSD